MTQFTERKRLNSSNVVSQEIRMVCRCVAAGCNNTQKDGFSLFLFPKDARLRKKWADQVRRTREKWMPTDHSVICNKHFDNNCFEESREEL